MKYFFLCLLGLVLPIYSLQTEVLPQLEFKHREADGVGYTGGYTTAEGLFGVKINDRHLPFVDLRWHVLNQGKQAANFGLVYRYRICEDLMTIGGNAYFDLRGSPGQTFTQASEGIEILNRFIDFRLNGYFPLNTAKELRKISFSGFQGHHIMIHRNYRSALTGGDGELGAYLENLQSFRFYGALGAYYFKRQQCNTNLGVRERVKMSWQDTLGLELSATHDNLYNTSVQGTLSFKYPLSKKRKKNERSKWNFYENRNQDFLQPVVRQELIPFCTFSETTHAINHSGEFLRLIFVSNVKRSGQTRSLATIENPYHTLLEAQSHSLPGDVIYVFPGNEMTKGQDKGMVLQDNQTFLDLNSNHPVETKYGTLNLTKQTKTYPRITNQNGPGLIASNNTLIKGFEIVNAQTEGIFADNVEKIMIEDVVITSSASNGIKVSSHDKLNEDVKLKNCFIRNSTNSGIQLLSQSDSTMNIVASGCVVEDSGSSGIEIFAKDSSKVIAKITNPIIRRSQNDGLHLEADSGSFFATVKGETIEQCQEGSGLLAILNNSQDGNFHIENCTITGYSLTQNSGATMQCETPQPPSKQILEDANQGSPFNTNGNISYIPLGTCGDT